MDSALHVAVGVVYDQEGNVLLTKRATHVHQGGLWEFPGGKLEQGESVLQALQRELQEEVGIMLESARPLIKIRHRYPDFYVLLDVWRVESFKGKAQAQEGQAMRWVDPRHLRDYAFPAANQAIVSASQLPDRYAILEGSSYDQVLQRLNCINEQGVRLLQLRVKSLPVKEIESIHRQVLSICRENGIKLLINSDLPLFRAEADGIHLSSRALMIADSRPLHHQWVAASCHNLKELKHAEQIGVDFVVLAPVLPTQSHPGAAAIGWENLAGLIEHVNIPVFALGGMMTKDIDRVVQAGGQGIAGISAFF